MFALCRWAHSAQRIPDVCFHCRSADVRVSAGIDCGANHASESWRYTAQTILGINGSDSLIVVRELGIANSAIGVVGLGTLVSPSWVPPLAMVGALSQV
jgi:hypothetical protein